MRDAALEIHRRSIAMLPAGSPAGLSREEALSLIGELQAANRRIVELERDLHQAAVQRHPSGEHRPR